MAGANLMVYDNENINPLIYAAMGGYVEVMYSNKSCVSLQNQTQEILINKSMQNMLFLHSCLQIYLSYCTHHHIFMLPYLNKGMQIL